MRFRITSLIVLVLGLAISLGLPAATTVKTINSVKLILADQEIPADELLDVSLLVFEPGIPNDQEKRDKQNIYPQVRKAESRYIPYVLRGTLEQTNLWGAVRMVPEEDPISEVVIRGSIQRSDGTEIGVRIEVKDATGKLWFEKDYKDTSSKFSYREDIDIPGDPFQDLYNAIANDIYLYRQKMKAADIRRIRTVANLKYAAELSPESFGQHLVMDQKGRWKINRLPSESDTMLNRVERIRDSEYLFIDTVDQQYASFFAQMDPSYSSWRRFSFEEVNAARELKSSSRKRMAVGIGTLIAGAAASSSSSSTTSILGQGAAISGLGLIKQGYDVGKQAKIHQDALQELAASFDAEVAPIVVEVEGEVVKLNGSLESQYKEWRRILRAIYADETGFPVQAAAADEFSPPSTP